MTHDIDTMFSRDTLDRVLQFIQEDAAIGEEIGERVELFIDRRAPLHDDDREYYVAYDAVCAELLACVTVSLTCHLK